MPPGEYILQVVLNKYETFHRSDGKTIKLHPDMGEGQHWNISPGNLYSKPQKIVIGPNAAPVSVALTEVIPSIKPPADTKYIRHIRIQSDVLTKFWGRPIYLGAIVLLPAGWETHSARTLLLAPCIAAAPEPTIHIDVGKMVGRW